MWRNGNSYAASGSISWTFRHLGNCQASSCEAMCEIQDSAILLLENACPVNQETYTKVSIIFMNYMTAGKLHHLPMPLFPHL